MKDDTVKFVAHLDELGITLTDQQVELFEKYYDLIVEKNKVMNLTAITDHSEFLIKHFLDSLAISHFTALSDKKIRVLDLGTGAGFPGIPLKIVFPNLKITLMDSLNKRIVFLNEVIKTLDLKDIEAVHCRAEEAGRKEEYREKYDIVVSRAVARLASLSEFCIPFVKKGGMFIPYKSGSSDDEISEAMFAIRELGAKYVKTEKFSLPGTDIERSFVFIEKEKQTPLKYPRAGGKPLNQPLLSSTKTKK